MGEVENKKQEVLKKITIADKIKNLKDIVIKILEKAKEERVSE